jgi:hypothetical protein
VVASFEAHVGRGKPHHVAWVGDTNLLVTSGVTKTGNRIVRVWDARMLCKHTPTAGGGGGDSATTTLPMGCISEHLLDVGSTVLVPHVVEESGVVVLTGRGEPKVRVLELQGTSRGVLPNAAAVGGKAKAQKSSQSEAALGQIHACSDYTFDAAVVSQPHSFALFPRRMCDPNKAEWARLAVLSGNALVPVSLTLPRAKDLNDYFGDDLFPETRAGLAVDDAQTWFKASSSSSSSPSPPSSVLSDCESGAADANR